MANIHCHPCGKYLSGYRRRSGITQCADCESYSEYQNALDNAIQRRLEEQTEEQPKRIFYAPEGYKRLTINLPQELHSAIKILAINEERTVTDIIVDLLEREIN